MIKRRTIVFASCVVCLIAALLYVGTYIGYRNRNLYELNIGGVTHVLNFDDSWTGTVCFEVFYCPAHLDSNFNNIGISRLPADDFHRENGRLVYRYVPTAKSLE
jgi:hypothetical protein